MKVKNVMFAGFAAAILSGVCGAAEAAEAKILASKGFVEAQVADKVSKETYNAHLEEQEAIDAKQTEDIASNLSKINALDEASGGNITGIVTRLDTLEGNASKEGSVAYDIAQAISGEVSRADAAYAEKGLETTVSNLQTNITNNYVSNTALEQKGYQTQANVQAEIAGATIQQSQVSGLADTLDGYVDDTTFTTYQGTVTEALDTKAAAGDVQTLQQTVAGFTNAESGIAATYATKTELSGVEAIAEAAQTAEEVQTAISTATSDMLTKTVAATTYATAEALAGVKATAEAAQTEEEVATAIDTKVATLDKEDAAVANEFVTAVSEADGVINVSRAALTAENIPELPQAKVTNLQTDLAGKLDKATENGSYLVTKTDTGVEYTAVQVVASDGTTNLLTGTELVTE